MKTIYAEINEDVDGRYVEWELILDKNLIEKLWELNNQKGEFPSKVSSVFVSDYWESMNCKNIEFENLSGVKIKGYKDEYDTLTVYLEGLGLAYFSDYTDEAIKYLEEYVKNCGINQRLKERNRYIFSDLHDYYIKKRQEELVNKTSINLIIEENNTTLSDEQLKEELFNCMESYMIKNDIIQK